MNPVNEFFKRLYSNPGLMWKGGAAVLFISMAAMIFFVPSITGGMAQGTRNMIGGFIAAYGLFRLFTFFIEYKQIKDEER